MNESFLSSSRTADPDGHPGVRGVVRGLLFAALFTIPFWLAVGAFLWVNFE